MSPIFAKTKEKEQKKKIVRNEEKEIISELTQSESQAQSEGPFKAECPKSWLGVIDFTAHYMGQKMNLIHK